MLSYGWQHCIGPISASAKLRFRLSHLVPMRVHELFDHACDRDWLLPLRKVTAVDGTQHDRLARCDVIADVIHSGASASGPNRNLLLTTPVRAASRIGHLHHPPRPEWTATCQLPDLRREKIEKFSSAARSGSICAAHSRMRSHDRRSIYRYAKPRFLECELFSTSAFKALHIAGIPGPGPRSSSWRFVLPRARCRRCAARGTHL